MYINKYLIFMITVIIITASFTCISYVFPKLNETDPINEKGEGSNNKTESGQSLYEDLISESDWENILSENETFADGESGFGTAHLKFSINDIYRLTIKMKIISEMCAACGGMGKGEVSVRIQMPSGEVSYQYVYTTTSDLKLLHTHPEEGEWQIFIEGAAVGEDYRIGYSIEVFVLRSDIS